MHFLMTALGSYGDVHPIAGLGGALRRRGHQVSIVANPHFQSVVESVGAEHIALGTLEDYDLFAELPDIWHPVRGPMLVMRVAVVELLRELHATLESNLRQGETVLVAHPLDLASRLLQEQYEIPLASLFLAPLAFRSVHDTPKLDKFLTADWVPKWLKRFQYWSVDRFVIDRVISPELNALRDELGMPPVDRILHEWYYSPQLVLGMFPDWFAPTQPDWLPQTHLTDFPLWDQPGDEGLSHEVEEFLRGGEPPIVFTPGSAMAHGQNFFQAAVDACRMLGRRGILLTKYPEQLPRELPSGVRHFSFVPLSQLLPRAAAFVHHGGIGSCSQGLSAGLPQLIMPMAYDQPDNAERLCRLGVAKAIVPKKFRANTVVHALDFLLSDQQTNERVHHWAKQCNGPAALLLCCELLEGLIG